MQPKIFFCEWGSPRVNLGAFCLLKFIVNNSPHCALRIGCKEKYVEETENAKLLDLHMYNHFVGSHIDQMIPNFIGACYRVKQLFHISHITTQFISHIFLYCTQCAC